MKHLIALIALVVLAAINGCAMRQIGPNTYAFVPRNAPAGGYGYNGGIPTVPPTYSPIPPQYSMYSTPWYTPPPSYYAVGPSVYSSGVYDRRAAGIYRPATQPIAPASNEAQASDEAEREAVRRELAANAEQEREAVRRELARQR